MMAFTQKAFRCMACKAVIHGEDTTLCSYCKSKEGEVYVKNLAKVRH
jgi:RNA polymerase subunit RPABC4/transcription elongation factor Spt4